MPKNFIRNYYDVYQLLQQQRVLGFIGTDKYIEHKDNRFRGDDEKDLSRNEAFVLSKPEIFDLYESEYKAKSNLYYGVQPEFREIIRFLNNYLDKL